MDYPEFAARASPQHGSFQGLVDYNLIPSSNPESQQTPRHLLVFVNGLMLPQTGWFPAMLEVLDKSRASSLPPVAMLSYDRPGQGQSGPHPKDAGLQPEHRHDCGDAANELADLIEHVLTLPDLPKSLNTSIVLICNSIGCPIARLYATQHLASLAGLVFLDSNVTNTDFVSCWPDPDEPDFDPSTLPEDVDANDLRMTRAKFRKVFHPSVPNPEGISRRNLPDLIPHGDRPVLYASDNNGPFLVVMGHDPQTFAEQSWTVSINPFSMAACILKSELGLINRRAAYKFRLRILCTI